MVYTTGCAIHPALGIFSAADKSSRISWIASFRHWSEWGRILAITSRRNACLSASGRFPNVAVPGKLQLDFRFVHGRGQPGMSAGGALGEMRDVLEIRRVENEHRNGPRLPVVAEELIHDVRILVPQKDSEIHARGLGDAHHGGEFAVHVAAPGFGDRQNFRRSVRQRGGLPEKRKVLVRQRHALIGLVEFVVIDGRFRQEFRVTRDPARTARA